MILVWRADTNPKVWTSAYVINHYELYELGLKANLCVPAPQPFPKSTLKVETEQEPADYIHAGSLFVVSEALRNIITEFGVHAEYHELDVVHCDRPYLKRRYFYVNLLEAIACLDYERSIYDRTPYGVTGIEMLFLDDAKAAGRQLFMLGPIAWAHSPNPLAVRGVVICAGEELARRILASDVTGVVFSRPEHRRLYPPPEWKPDDPFPRVNVIS